jgi:hypothetical protein
MRLMEENRPWWGVRTSNPGEAASLSQVGSTPALFRHFHTLVKSMVPTCTTDFDDWMIETFARVGSFTMLIVLVDIGETTVSPLASSYLHVVGNETRWNDMVDLLSAAGTPWNGAAFYQADRGGLIDDMSARHRLSSLTRHLEKDRSLLAHAEFFNAQGLRLKIEEVRGRESSRSDAIRT